MSVFATARDRVAEIDAEIIRLQKEREPLKDRLESYKYPVLTLPNEIISEFFIHVIPPYPLRAPTTGPFSPTALGQICHKWRDIALSTPVLWSSLSITLEYRTLKKKFMFLETWLSRSRSHPVSISLIDQRGEVGLAEINRFLQAICLHASHLDYLELRLPLGDSNLPLLQQPMPLLSSVELFCDRVDTEAPVPVFQASPRLRKINIHRFTANLVFPWSQMSTFTCDYIAYSDLAPLLGLAAESLVHCYVKHMRLGSSPTLITPLLALESLIFSGNFVPAYPLFFLNGLLSTMTLPALRRLHIPEEYLGAQPIHKLVAFIEKSGCSLQELRIIDPRLQRDIYRKAFASIPLLEFVFEDADEQYEQGLEDEDADKDENDDEDDDGDGDGSSDENEDEYGEQGEDNSSDGDEERSDDD
jgi:hypothetical protein